MIHLLKKDLLIQKKSFLFLFVYGIFMFFIFNNPVFEGMVYIMGMIIGVYFFLITASMEEERNKSEIVLNSLPVSRNRIVMAKYLSVFVYVLIGAIFLGFLGLLFQLPAIPIQTRLLKATDLLAVIFLISVAVSIYFPLYFHFGASALRLFSVIFFLFFFFVPRWLFELYLAYEETDTIHFLKNIIEQFPLLPVVVILLIAFLLLTGSFFYSRKIYLKKEF